MSGEQSLEEQLDKKIQDLYLDKLNDDYEQVAKYLTLREDELSVLDAETCFTRSAELTQFSISIKLYENRQRAILSWADSEVNKIASGHWSNYKNEFMSNDVRIYAIAGENPKISKFLELKSRTESLLQDVQNIANNIQKYAEIFLQLGKVKQYANK